MAARHGPRRSSSSTGPPTTPVGVVTDASRPGEHVVRHDASTDSTASTVGMLSIVIVGSSSSFETNGRIVTPRGYEL